jgi:cell division protein FtsA
VISKSKFIGAVEIGTSKVTVLVGELSQGRSLSIVGLGECQSRGVIKGGVVDFRAASDSTQAALLSAEQSAGIRISEVVLAQTGEHLDGFYNEGTVNVSSADNRVSAYDIETVTNLAKSKSLPEGRTVIHHLKRPFRLDGRSVPDPAQLNGSRLSMGIWTVHGVSNKIADHIHIISGFSVKVRDLVLSGLASGSVVTSAEDRQNGVLVLDIGGGTTDYVLYREGLPYVAGVVPVGGAHFTNDLALGLRLTEGQAEKMKQHFGRGVVTTRDKSERVWLNGDYAIGDRSFPRVTLEQVTAARATELFEVVKKKLGSVFSPESIPAGVVLTGGTTKLEGLDEAAARVFGVQARRGEAPGWVDERLRAPHYSTALGLMKCGLNMDETSNAPRRSSAGGFIRRLFTVGA